MYNGSQYNVDHVSLRGYDLYVALDGVHGAVHSDELIVEWTEFDTERTDK